MFYSYTFAGEIGHYRVPQEVPTPQRAHLALYCGNVFFFILYIICLIKDIMYNVLYKYAFSGRV